MKNKKEKINLIMIICLFLIITILLAIIILSAIKGANKFPSETKNKTYKITILRGYELNNLSKASGVLKNYDEYVDLLKTFGTTDKENMDEKFRDNKQYVYYADIINPCSESVIYDNYDLNNKTITLNFTVKEMCGYCSNEYILFLIEVDKNMQLNNVVENFEYIKNNDCNMEVEKKPILYLYPKTTTNISVKLEKNNQIITSYPKYNNGWNVIANPNGDLYDANGNYYYALYWDEINQNNVDFSQGFYVSKDNAIEFLEEKLDKIGLNKKERNEFIMYWLPILENNEHNLIYFELTEERESNNAIIIDPKPDSLLRINMHIKKIEKQETIQEQILPTFQRKGFVAVEWGGTIHK